MTTSSPEPAQPPAPESPGAEQPNEPEVLPVRGADDTDTGWGERWDAERDSGGDDERYLRERPPHWE